MSLTPEQRPFGVKKTNKRKIVNSFSIHTHPRVMKLDDGTVKISICLQDDEVKSWGTFYKDELRKMEFKEEHEEEGEERFIVFRKTLEVEIFWKEE